MTAPPYDFGQQAPAQGTASSAGASQPTATNAAAGQSSQATGPGTGSLSVTTNPAGAAVELDGIPQGASPATIPGLAAGTHNLTIMKPGYTVLYTQVSIVAGQANEYSTTLLPSTEPTKKQSPGFELTIAGLAVAGILLLRRIR
ncbi:MULTISPECIES: PEGA domain-containing protein [unclassified Methanoregula]|uniref:PEGA domain-containing protein n=1 Tax=unclassified Methanoregula TaxID=2649730 RepID=UPI0009D4D54E|nr:MULTISPECIES: PEGA domain-containing protein [unclassified Methanoregula]OPX64689.1 MAG: PEGA domain protein [Methanoregula sp. PtaB.Bin085]OPY36057.1 MAG: PEGA domain protein [Methanoregula sp. PtaU1.Bin006]